MDCGRHLYTTGFLLLCTLVTFSSALQCSQTDSPAVYTALPTIYNSVSVINPGVGSCSLVRTSFFECNYDIVLGDGVSVPSPPDLSSQSYLEHFIAWKRNSEFPYVDFDISGSSNSINAIELSFLNSPANSISLPDIELVEIRYGTTIALNMEDAIASVLIENQDLTQNDNQVRTVTVRPILSTQPTLNNIRIKFLFTEFQTFEWILLNEVRFCTESQPSYQPVITFGVPATDSSSVQPTGSELSSRSTELICTVSNEGPHTWQWKRNEVTIMNSNPSYDITIGDGSRTTKLIISDLNFSDAGRYECEATTMDLSNSAISTSRVQVLEFPENIITAPDKTGFRDTGEVVMNCELHGYQSSLTHPVWLDTASSEIGDTNKYTLTPGRGINTITLENGTTVPSFTVALTIRDIDDGDAGNYTCRSTSGQTSVTQLTIVGGTAPPTTPPPPTTATMTTGGSSTGIGNMTDTTDNTGGPEPAGDNSGIVAAAVIVSLIIVLSLVGIALLGFVFLWIKGRDDKINISPTPNGNSIIRVNERRLTKQDIEWQISNDNNQTSATNAIYSMIEKKPSVPPPPVPPQDFDQNDFADMGFEETEDKGKEYEDGTLYAQPGLKAPRRRLTNSTKPKLAKITSVDPKYSLDSNPIYESTSSSLSKMGMSNGSLNANPLYAEPDRRSFTATSSGEPIYSEAINPTHFTQNHTNNRSSFASVSTTSGGEPIYSEALNPSSFTQDQPKNDSDLHPYGPVYAEPSVVRKSKAPLSVTPYNILEDRVLGVGQFGEVALGRTVGLSMKDLNLGKDTDKNAQILVAIKKLKPQADGSVRDSFEKEIKFMSGLDDDNIVRFLAVCNEDPKFIVIEYMENGDLHQFLNNHELATSNLNILANQLPVSILLYMAVQISSGMRYLASFKYVHRDLASRNCLVGKNFVVKISDFGMSRSLYESVYYRVRGRAMLPIRWMATESFYGRFSEKTDVWSFGVIMWEIFTLGRHQPYEELDDQQVIHDAVRNKQRQLLAKPEACPDDVYRVMLRCWDYKLENRANFSEIFSSLAAIHTLM